MRKRLGSIGLAALVFFVLCVLVVLAGQGWPSWKPDEDVSYAAENVKQIGQTWTMPEDKQGRLGRAKFWMHRAITPTGAVTVEVFDVDANQHPTGTHIAIATMAISDITTTQENPQQYWFEFDDIPKVCTDTMYAFVFTTDSDASGNVHFWASSAVTYTEGNFISRPNETSPWDDDGCVDFLFATDPLEPYNVEGKVTTRDTPGFWEYRIEGTWGYDGGYQDLKQCYLHINDTAGYTNACTVQYNQKKDKIWLMDDSATTWLGGHEPGSSNTISNSQCTVMCEDAQILTSTYTLTLQLPVEFKYPFTGTKKIFMKVHDYGGNHSEGENMGQFAIPPYAWMPKWLGPNDSQIRTENGDEWIAQTFTTPSDMQPTQISGIDVNIARLGAFGVITYGLYGTDGNGKPNLNDPKATSTINTNDFVYGWPSTPPTYTMTFLEFSTHPTVTAGTKYALAISQGSPCTFLYATGTNSDTTPVGQMYANGAYGYQDSDSGSWYLYDGDWHLDMRFRVRGVE